jgi:hypothetical protein
MKASLFALPIFSISASVLPGNYPSMVDNVVACRHGTWFSDALFGAGGWLYSQVTMQNIMLSARTTLAGYVT